MDVELREKQLFPPLKAHFKQHGFRVFTEVPCFYRSVDFVAVKDGEQIAVEMKMSLTKGVIYQANQNTVSFHRSCIAIPTRPRDDSANLAACYSLGLGLLQVWKGKVVVELIQGVLHKPFRVYDFSTFEESDDDEAGLPFQKGVSAAFTVLDRIKKYVTEHPTADWKEIYENVQHHYSSKESLAGSMQTWKGFSLDAFKSSLSQK